MINHIVINNQKDLFGCGGNRLYMCCYVSRTRYRLSQCIFTLFILIYLLEYALGSLSNA